MKQTSKTYQINASPLFRLSSISKLSELLSVPKRVLRNVKSIVCYTSFEEAKPDGGVRTISCPCRELRRYQRSLFRLLRRISTPDYLCSGQRGSCYIDNAVAHISSDYLVKMDIAKFFDRCTDEYVFRFFHYTMSMSSDVARALTYLTTYRGSIPTGTPTSQILAYWSYREMFDEIASLVGVNSTKITVYVDDVTISSSKPISHRIGTDVSAILNRYGHKLKWKKLQFYRPEQHKLVTGVVLTPMHGLSVPYGLRAKIHRELRSNPDWKKSPTLLGRIAAAQSICPRCYTALRRELKIES